jgi:geranylgeranyl diphosphate synthase type II
MRGLLTLLACESVGGNSRHALDAAAAIEMLHNFTLIHDDVMDNAALRRHRPTVHTKWNANVAILAGDELIALAYESLLKTKSKNIHEIVRVFTNAFIEVCEGQGFDKEYEDKRSVTASEYLLMIKKKTACVISAAAEIGALAGEGTPRQILSLKTFGEHLGIAFQINDDLLDITGDEREFGKTIGGDIKERKKTFLLLKALEQTTGQDQVFLRSLRMRRRITTTVINRTRAIYETTGVVQLSRKEILKHTTRAQQALSRLTEHRSKQMLLRLADELSERTN